MQSNITETASMQSDSVMATIKYYPKEGIIEEKIPELSTKTLQGFLGYEKPTGKSDQKNFTDDDDEFSDEEEGEFKDLIIYWRIDEGKGVKLKDLSNYKNNGKIFKASWK